jgi:hypothetical protein
VWVWAVGPTQLKCMISTLPLPHTAQMHTCQQPSSGRRDSILSGTVDTAIALSSGLWILLEILFEDCLRYLWVCAGRAAAAAEALMLVRRFCRLSGQGVVRNCVCSLISLSIVCAGRAAAAAEASMLVCRSCCLSGQGGV